MNVFWLLTAQERLRADLHGKPEGLAGWLPRLNAVLAEVFSGQVVLVRDRYSGYREFEGLVVLFVEIQPAAAESQARFPSPGTYIVKIAFDEKRQVLKKEINSWDRSRPSIFTAIMFSCLWRHIRMQMNRLRWFTATPTPCSGNATSLAWRKRLAWPAALAFLSRVRLSVCYGFFISA